MVIESLGVKALGPMLNRRLFVTVGWTRKSLINITIIMDQTININLVSALKTLPMSLEEKNIILVQASKPFELMVVSFETTIFMV